MRKIAILFAGVVLSVSCLASRHVFSIKDAELHLNNQPFKMIGLRCSNALISDETTQELIDHLDLYGSYGVNTVSVYFMGSRFGDVKGYRPDATLDPDYSYRMARIIEAADERGMVVLVGCLYWSTSKAKEELSHWTQSEANLAVANTVRWLVRNNYRNVLVDPDNEGMAVRSNNWRVESMIAAAHEVDPTIMVGNNTRQKAGNSDLNIHFGPKEKHKPWVDTEATPGKTPGGYWGDYSKETHRADQDYYNYSRIGRYTEEMKQHQLERTAKEIEAFNGHVIASTWLQCAPDEGVGGPFCRPGGRSELGSGDNTEAPWNKAIDRIHPEAGILWWLEFIKENYGAWKGVSSAGQTSPDRASGSSADNGRMEPFPVDWRNIPSGPADLSFLNEKPAGEDGFLEIRDGHFYTPEGERIRIWGVNLTAGACFPEKPDAPQVAHLLASLGINGVRFHFLDSDWGAERSIFRYDTATTRVLNPKQLDKLDYFVAELKKQGIYTNFNLNVGRNYREKDGVPFHEYLGLAKAVTIFDDHLIALQKEYARMLLTHRNPYTGREYRNEPALAFLEIVNENSLLEAWSRGRLRGKHHSTRTSTWIDIPAYYAAELTLKYNAWLDRNLSNEQLATLRREAGVEEGALIPRLDPDEFGEASEFRFHSEARFIMETENNFYYGMYRYLKDSVGARQLVAANSDHSHYSSSYALLSSTSRLDFVDGHVYWQHPNYTRDPETGKRSFLIENTPMVNEPLWSTPVQLSRSAVRGKPYTVSETNHPYPNEYACEGYPILGAYALLQDWDGIYFYTFEHGDPSSWGREAPGHFDIMHDPVKMANLHAGALMFHRGDVKPADTTVFRHYSEPGMIEAIREDPAPRPFFTPGFDQSIPLIHKTRIASFSGGENNYPEVPDAMPVVSESGQLRWHLEEGRGAVVVNTPETQALIGFSHVTGDQSAGNLEVEPLNGFTSALLTSMDGKPIGSSGKLLLTLTASSILSGAEWNADRTTLKSFGELPYEIENVTATVTLSGLEKQKHMTVYPLNGNWELSGDPIPAVREKGKWVFKTGAVPAVTYVLELE